MLRALPVAIAAMALLAGCAANPPRADLDALRKQVMDTERAFARTMAERNFPAFASFLAEDAIFYAGPKPIRGKQAVAADWKKFYEKPEAPFSWEPQHVEVLDSGTLAHSSGPVRDPSGKVFATFNSIWRLEAPGVWRVVFDKGSEVCKP
jgi:ketosteroid isomerase-like protein